MDFEQLTLRLVDTIKKYRSLLIYIKGSPDPDAIAASYALKLICKHYGCKAVIVSPVYPSLPQNVKMIKDLHLPVQFEAPEKYKDRAEAYAVLDHQSRVVEGLTGVLPCALHIDHHEPVKESVPADLAILAREVGSTSTVMAFILEQLAEELNLSKKLRVRVATALYYGMQTDTDDFSHVEALDGDARRLIFPDCDNKLLRGLSATSYSKEFMQFFDRALQAQVVYKGWLMAGIGFVEEKYRDAGAIVGDFLMKREDIDTVAVFSIVEKSKGMMLNVSFRTKDEDFNLNEFIKQITSNGGGRKYKGAYQVDLDYFAHCPDREMLWKLVALTTVETLKRQRDAGGIENFMDSLRRLKGKLFDVFR